MTEPDENGWMPIETAPKGRAVKVYGPDPAHGHYKGPAIFEGGRWRKLHRQGFLNMRAFPTHWLEKLRRKRKR